jgi:hypothetical protein
MFIWELRPICLGAAQHDLGTAQAVVEHLRFSYVTRQ